MSRFLVLVVVTLALSGDGCVGNEGITGLQDLSDSDYSQIPEKRLRSADPATLSDAPRACHFYHEGAADGRLVCRLRFTRSKFNFNPFGLRFGKREESSVTRRAATSGYIVAYLLQLKDRLMPPCRPEPAQRC